MHCQKNGGRHKNIKTPIDYRHKTLLLLLLIDRNYYYEGLGKSNNS